MKKRWIIIGMAVVGILTGSIAFYQYFQSRNPIENLMRNPPGMGETTFHLEAKTEEGSFPVDIALGERAYSEDELEEIFDAVKAWLDTVWLANNASKDAVTSDLYFPTYTEEYGLRIRWETENYQWIQTDGTVTEAAYKSSPLSTYVKATVYYGEIERSYTYEIVVTEKENMKKSTMEDAVENELKILESENPDASIVSLPTTIDGKKIQWYTKNTPLWPKVFVFGSLILILLWFSGEERKMQQAKERSKALEQDYPEIVYRLVLLIGAGMTVKSAWEKVIEGYKREKIITGKSRWGYEEMEMTWREMNYGIAEVKAYENFGTRCGSQNYIRLSALMIQQLKRGAKGMNQLLLQEVSSAELLWRENSRKKAEEAGTKLLVPMVLLMSVVFAVLVIPAFLSMSV